MLILRSLFCYIWCRFQIHSTSSSL